MHLASRAAFLTRLGTLLTAGLVLVACARAPGAPPAPVVGTWLMQIPEAPFPVHLFTFHADGTVLQSNPDAGDPGSSDSNAMGAWQATPQGIRGRLVEVLADRGTRRFTGRGEISFVLTVTDDTFQGTASAVFYDPQGAQVRGPVQASLQGQRVSPRP
ncbi:MAG: hypothetical protein JSR36_13965 [Proteobacteria bacterium]|nr:hypothetical protein [Pseudomonadota bacterium]